MSYVLSDAAVTSADWLRREEDRVFGRYALVRAVCVGVIAFVIRYRPAEVRSGQHQSQGLPGAS